MTPAPPIGTDRPFTPGIYAARQWYGWRILEWRNDQWWHPGCAAKWPSEAKGCGIEQWCGPLPGGERAPVEYDL